MIELVPIFGLAAAIGFGGFQVWNHFNPKMPSRILNPANGAECDGRNVTVSGVISRPRKRAAYWVAIQPCNCRGAGVWWPQRHRLQLDWKGAWVLKRATLGRVGDEDIGATFTLGLFEVLESAQDIFEAMAAEGERLDFSQVSQGCNHIDTVEVRRVG